MIVLDAPMNSLLSGNGYYWATLWKIERVDGTIFRFTDHDKTLVGGNGDIFVPAGGFDGTARQKQAGLRVQNFEARGAITNGWF